MTSDLAAASSGFITAPARPISPFTDFNRFLNLFGEVNMLRNYRSLIKAFGRAAEAQPQDVLEAISTLPPVGELPSPWTTWLFIALMSWRKRQQWAKDMLREHLPKAIPPCRKFREREQPVEMFVPGCPEWEVSLECDYTFAQLTNRVTEEFLIIDLATVDRESLIYVDHLDSCVGPKSRSESIERLLELHQDFGTIQHAIDDLVAANLLRAVYDDRSPCPPDMHPNGHLLASRAVVHADVVEGFVRQWKNAGARLWLSAVIGDWLAAHELAVVGGDPQLIAVTKERADECRAIRLTLARESFASAKQNHGIWDSGAVRMMADLGAEEVRELIREGLAGNADCVCSVICVINRDEDPSWCNAVFDVLLRFGRCGRRTRDEDVVLQCARYLFKHRHRKQDVARVLSRLKSQTDEAGLLLLEHAPHQALPIIRRALRDSGPIGNPTAAVLALIDQPWSRAELLAVLEDDVYHDLDDVLPLVLALHESHDAEARAVAETWVERYDPAVVEWGQEDLTTDMVQFGDRVLKLRRQAPA